MKIKTKIIATLGPASSDVSTLRRMFMAGLDVVRLNFSHGTKTEHLQRIKTVRSLNKKYRRAVKIMQDLEGYRIRLGRVKGKGLVVKKGNVLWLTQDDVLADKNVLSFDYRGSLMPIKKGMFIYIDDARIALRVEGVYKKSLKTLVVRPGRIQAHKGVNIPGADLEFEAFTAKDTKDLEFGLKHKVDFIAQSFVRSADDIILLKKRLPVKNPPLVFAKIENAQGLNNLSEILKVSDGVLVARGDMGISFPIYMVGILQKIIIQRARGFKKPVITATQMLESMTDSVLPTRAEVTDVTNAIIDGSDYVMLSEETAAGRYPAESVRMMNEIIKFTEKSAFYPGKKK